MKFTELKQDTNMVEDMGIRLIDDNHRFVVSKFSNNYEYCPFVKYSPCFSQDKIIGCKPEYSRSWGCSPSDNLVAVGIHVGDLFFLLQNMEKNGDILNTTEFWQSDDYESTLENTKIIKRRIQMKIDDGWFTVEINPETRDFDFYISDKKI